MTRQPWEIVTVIPARGGSKGLPRKNVQTVGGIPLIVRTIRAAKEAALGDIIVSTDDLEIEELSLAEGVQVYKRSAETASDTASSESALLEVSGKLLSENTKVLIFLQCTSPFLLAEDIRGAYLLYQLANHNSVFAGCEHHGFLWTHNAKPINHEGVVRRRRQDCNRQYLEAGSVYVMNHAAFRKEGYRFIDPIGIYRVPASRVFEIDTFEDLKIARQLALSMDPPPEDKTIYIDLDATLCVTPVPHTYDAAVPIPEAIREVNELYKTNRVVIWSARGMGSGVDYRAMTIEQLNRWGVKYHELTLRKPIFDWLIDDRSRQLPVYSQLQS